MSEEPTKPEEKKFGLKNIEQQMLQSMQDGYFNHLSNFLTFVATERLAYTVTTNTKFAVEGDTLKIWEEEPQEAPSEPVAPSVATSDTPTADALKGPSNASKA